MRSCDSLNARRFARHLLFAAVAVALGACASRSSDITGSVPLAARSDADWRNQIDSWGERYRAHPTDPSVALNYAQALRATGQRTQAEAVLEHASLANPHDRALLGAYGRALADVGKYQQALDVLSRAHTPDQPDWRILSAQGAILDQMGRHDDAQRYYSSALKIQPDEPSILSNLGLSYALAKNLPEAEKTLRRANERSSTDPRVRQNLALVVGLQGRFAEAEQIARADLPADEAAANVAYLKQMMAQHQQGAAPAAKPARTAGQGRVAKVDD